MQCLYTEHTGLLWIFSGLRRRIQGWVPTKTGWKNNKIPIVAYRHVLITACRLTPRARDSKQLGRLDLGSPERQHTGYADTVRIRARNNCQSHRFRFHYSSTSAVSVVAISQYCVLYYHHDVSDNTVIYYNKTIMWGFKIFQISFVTNNNVHAHVSYCFYFSKIISSLRTTTFRYLKRA